MEKQVPDNYHALYDLGYRAANHTLELAPAQRTVGHERMAAENPDLVISYDESTQLPNRVTVRQPEARVSRESAQTPDEAALAFVQSQGDLWNLTPEDIDTIEVLSVSEKGVKTVRLVQNVDGREVFGSDVTVAVTNNNEVASVAGQFFPQTATARSEAAAANMTSEVDAIALAVFDLTGVQYAPALFALDSAAGGDGSYRFYKFTLPEGDPRPAFTRPVRLKDVVFPLGAGSYAPGYYMELWVQGLATFSYIISSSGAPEVLFRKNLSSNALFSYRVYNTGDTIFRSTDGPAPGTPHPTGVPDGFQAPIIDPILVQIESLLPGDPWLADGAQTTDGNNCIAYADITHPDGLSANDVMGQVTAPAVFDHIYDHTQGSHTPNNLQAGIVGMFFHVNWLHDRWYEAGFDEASGNAQKDNFGRGGIGGDPILAEANDFAGTDNARMSTPADGDSPQMEMFNFIGVGASLPSRTSNFEALITFHEMGHYITNRLIGNGSGLSNVQGRAMGEGWGDFFAICMTSQSIDDFANGVFAVGGWTDVTPNFKENYYFSIRRYPYTADMAKNPLTFGHISANVILPFGPPINPNAQGPNNEFHNAGEVWCTILWELFVNLVQKHGHEEAERRVLLYVVNGLKMTPNQPTFTEARDGIVDAVTALQPDDLREVWLGFAKRGLGVDAVSPPRNSPSLAGVVQSFEIPVQLRMVPVPVP